MGIFSGLFSSSVAAPVDAIGSALDKLFTSDEERAQAKIVMEKLRQHPAELQVELNKIEAQHRSIFVAGWRSSIGWVCSFGLFYDVVARPIMNGFGFDFPSIDSPALQSMVISLLGLGTLRTAEKFGGKTK